MKQNTTGKRLDELEREVALLKEVAGLQQDLNKIFVEFMKATEDFGKAILGK